MTERSERGKTEALPDGKTPRVEALAQDGVIPRHAACYRKPQFAFSDALAAVRQRPLSIGDVLHLTGCQRNRESPPRPAEPASPPQWPKSNLEGDE